MKLYIKHMVSIRCTMFVRSELQKMGFFNCNVKLGEVFCTDNLSSIQLEHLKGVLHEAGLEVLDNKKSILIMQMKNIKHICAFLLVLTVYSNASSLTEIN